MRKKLLNALALFSFLLLSAQAQPQENAKQTTSQADQPILLQILAVNDFHGNLDTISHFIDQHGTQLDVGGASYLATNLDQAEKDFLAYAKEQQKEAYSIRVQAGDLIGGSPPISALLQHEPTLMAFQKMNFEINALGNHEFDQGFKELSRVLEAKTIHPKVKEYTQGFDYRYTGLNKNTDYIASNFKSKNTNELLLPAYTIRDFGGIKVGFIGTITQDTPRVVLKEHTEDYDFTDPAPEVDRYANELIQQGVNAIVVVGHNGAYQDEKAPLVLNGSSKEITGESADIAKNTPQEVGVIISGHSHTAINGYVEGTFINQNYKYGQAFGDVWFELDPQTGKFVRTADNKVKVRATIRPNIRTVEKHPEVEAIVSQAKAISEKVTHSVIGYAENGEAILDDHPDDESPLGNLITDGMKVLTKTDIALTNSGGIRLPLTPKKVDDKHVITWGAAYEVQPFNNMLGIYEMTGQAIKDGIAQQFQEAKGFIQFSGLKYTYKKTPEGSAWPYEIVSMALENGTPLEMDKPYTVSMNKFIAGGGDGYTEFKAGKLLKEHPISDTETFIDYINQLNTQKQIIAPRVEGRAIEVYDDLSDLYAELKTFQETKQLIEPESYTVLQQALKNVLEHEDEQNMFRQALKDYQTLIAKEFDDNHITPYAYRVLNTNLEYNLEKY